MINDHDRFVEPQPLFWYIIRQHMYTKSINIFDVQICYRREFFSFVCSKQKKTTIIIVNRMQIKQLTLSIRIGKSQNQHIPIVLKIN